MYFYIYVCAHMYFTYVFTVICIFVLELFCAIITSLLVCLKHSTVSLLPFENPAHYLLFPCFTVGSDLMIHGITYPGTCPWAINETQENPPFQKLFWMTLASYFFSNLLIFIHRQPCFSPLQMKHLPLTSYTTMTTGCYLWQVINLSVISSLLPVS